MVYKTVILSEIVKYDESEEKIQFNHALMNEEQKLLFLHYKREIFKEAIIVSEGGAIKLDETVMKPLNADVDELDLTRLNSRQKFLIDCCIKELEKKTNPDVYNEHKLQLKRKRNNECASKFREKRRKIEKVNDIIKEHLKEIFREHVKGLAKEHVEQIRRFLMEKNLVNSLNYLDNYKKRFEMSSGATVNSAGSEASFLEDDDKSYSSSNENTNMSDDCSSVSDNSQSRRAETMNSKVETDFKNIRISPLAYKKAVCNMYENSILTNGNNKNTNTNTNPTASTDNISAATAMLNTLNSINIQKQQQQFQNPTLLTSLPQHYLTTLSNQNQSQLLAPVIVIPNIAALSHAYPEYYGLMIPSAYNTSNSNNTKVLISQ